MERRGFIKGLLTAVAGTAATIQLAKPGEAAALIAQRDLLLAQPEPINVDQSMEALPSCPEVFCYLKGKLVPIGFIREVHVDQPIHEVYSWGGEIAVTHHQPQFVAGLKRMTMKFGGPNL